MVLKVLASHLHGKLTILGRVWGFPEYYGQELRQIWLYDDGASEVIEFIKGRKILALFDRWQYARRECRVNCRRSLFFRSMP